MDTLAMIQAMKASISEVLEQMFFYPSTWLKPKKKTSPQAPTTSRP